GERAALHQRIDLGPLEAAAAGALLRKLLEPAENVPADVVDHLMARTQRVPRLLAELVRGLKRDGLVRRAAKGDAWYLAIDALGTPPDSPLLEWLASRELSWLPPELARHAQLLSLLGPWFTRFEVAGVLLELDRAGLGAELALDSDVAIGRLIDSGLVVEAGRLSFRSGVVRETVERATPQALAQPIHEAAYRFY